MSDKKTRYELKKEAEQAKIKWDIVHEMKSLYFHSKTHHKIECKIKGIKLENIGGSINLMCPCNKCGIKIKGKKAEKMENTEEKEIIIERNENGCPVDCPSDCGQYNIETKACDNCSKRVKDTDKLQEWEHHVIKEKITEHEFISYCGKTVYNTDEWLYLNKEHVFNSIDTSVEQPCPKCLDKIKVEQNQE